MARKISMVAIMTLLVGCFYRAGWEGDRNKFVGLKLDPELILVDGYYAPLDFINYFFHWSSGRKFDRAEPEGGGTRYYITYGGECRYSIFLDGDNVMRSWRYETSNRSQCIVY